MILRVTLDVSCEDNSHEEIEEDMAGEMMLREALRAPLQQILKNAGLDEKEIMSDIYTPEMLGTVDDAPEEPINNKGYNVVTGEYGDMFEMGIVDPAKVTKEALLNAISVATTILTTNAIVTHKRA